MSEPFEELESKVDALENEIQSKLLMFESLVVNGQRMANLLRDLIDGDMLNKEEAKELIARWEKEFK